MSRTSFWGSGGVSVLGGGGWAEEVMEENDLWIAAGRDKPYPYGGLGVCGDFVYLDQIDKLSFSRG